jgi:Catalytic LigB subunit of aromatic ring-opening dioxygenase
MAQLVYGFGSSHSPQLNMPAEAWHIRAQADRRIRDLIGVDGEVSGYEDLMNRRDDLSIIAKEITPEKFDKRHQENQAAINRISEALYRVDPDILVMVGDDQQEYLRDDNMPGMCVYWGDEVLVKAIPTVNGVEAIGDSQKDRTVPTHSALGRHLIEYLVEAEFDVGRSSFLEGGRADGGIGHAFSYVYHRLMTGKVIPTVPIMVNTYYPPNQPTPKRCIEFGRALGRAIKSWHGNERVAVVASGGVSHFVVDEAFDRRLLTAMQKRDYKVLAEEPDVHFRSGTSETKNWLVVAGMLAETKLDMDLLDYVPCYRSEAGTGSGMAFATWQ